MIGPEWFVVGALVFYGAQVGAVYLKEQYWGSLGARSKKAKAGTGRTHITYEPHRRTADVYTGGMTPGDLPLLDQLKVPLTTMAGNVIITWYFLTYLFEGSIPDVLAQFSTGLKLLLVVGLVAGSWITARIHLWGVVEEAHFQSMEKRWKQGRRLRRR